MIKNKKMILAFIVLIVFIEKCTVINILSPSLLKKSKYDDYTYLYEGVTTTNSEIIRISESPYNAIAYHEKENYFIVYGDDKISKLNSRGVENFSIDIQEGVCFADFGAFVFTDTKVYDLSQEIIKEIKIKKIIHATEEQVKLKGFLNLLNQYYNKASKVLYIATYDPDNHKVFLKIGNDWIGLYISKKNSFGINFHSNGEILKKFPEKYKRLIVLKNPVNEVYSTRSSGSETFSSLSYDVAPSKEEELDYPKNKKITISYYQKEKTLAVFPYTSIPVSFRGDAYFNLKIGNELYKFKEMGVKSVGFSFTIAHDISYYVLPKKYNKNSAVSFLKVFPSSSLRETGSKGLYVVRPIHTKNE